MSNPVPRSALAWAAVVVLAALPLAVVGAPTPVAAQAQPGASVSDPAPKVTCIGDGSSGPRFQMVYARRSNHADGFAVVEPQAKGWAAGIEQAFALSARKTGGERVPRFVHDDDCVAVVLEVVVPDTVTSFSGLVQALHDLGYDSRDRKWLVAWDDDDGVSNFCGLGQYYDDSRPGPANLHEVNSLSMVGAVENGCWKTSTFAHELMHTLGAVQSDAPNWADEGHCTDDQDLMCAPPAGTPDVCPAAGVVLYDCGDDDYFNTDPPPGSYLATHLNTASSRFLDPDPPLGPPAGGVSPAIVPEAGGVTVSWGAPEHDGGSPVTAYLVTLSNGRSVVVPASDLQVTITGLPDGVPVKATVAAINAQGNGAANPTGSAIPTPLVETIAADAGGRTWTDLVAGPDGSAYVATADAIVRLEPDGTMTTVVGGTGTGEGTAPLSTRVRPGDLAVAPNGDLFWYDTSTRTIRRLHDGLVTTVAGSGVAGSGGDGGPATSAQLQVDGIAVGRDSATVYLVSAASSTVRRFTVGGDITTVAGEPGVPASADAPLGDGGPAADAHFDGPRDITIDTSGAVDTIYVADYGENRVRAFTDGGTIDTVAGTGSATAGSAGPVDALDTGVAFPRGVDWSDRGLTIATGTDLRALLDGRLTRIAGDPPDGTSDDGHPATLTDISDQESIRAIAWSGDTLYLLTNGSAGSASPGGRVRAIGPWSGAEPAGSPPAPVVPPAAAPAPASAIVTWPPAGNDGSTITGYRITASDGTVLTVGPNATSARVTGLTPGQPYTFTVTAVNGQGDGETSAPSDEIVPTGILPDGSEGQAYAGPAAGGAPGSTWSTASPLPAGLVLDPVTGAISGTPAEGSEGTYPVALTETDRAGRTFTTTVQLRVLPEALGAPMAQPGMVVLIGLGAVVLTLAGRRRLAG